MNKKLISILICLALASLACLQTAMPPAQRGTAEPVEETSPTQTEMVDVGISPSPQPSPAGRGGDAAPQICAVVTAARSVNLREGPSEHAAWMMWLLRDDQVRVIDQTIADWWLVDVDGVIGYVRSAYVGERECER